MIITSILAYFLAILVLVTFHEFGHFWVARRCGVKVLRFSIGFGKSLYTYRSGRGTEYSLGLIPLGGYVKMLDETEGPVAPEEQAHAFNRQSVWKRLLIVSAGPLANWILAIFIFWIIFMMGLKSPIPLIGEITPQSVAAKAGLLPQQEIIRVGEVSTPSWRQVQLELAHYLGTKQPIALTVKDSQQQLHHYSLDTRVWAVNPEAPDPLNSLGIKAYQPPIPPIVNEIKPHSVAANAGIQKGDQLLQADGIAIKDWQGFVNYIKVRPQQSVRLTVQRGTQTLQISVVPALSVQQGESRGVLGVLSLPMQWPDELMRKQRFTPLGAIAPALDNTLGLTRLSFVMLGKMVTGHISLQSLSGPVGIASGAGHSALAGLEAYLLFLAFVSISLAVLNVLPIPLLDGGHMLFYVVEIIQRRPVQERTRQLGFRFGIIVLGTMMTVAIVNDISRLLGS